MSEAMWFVLGVLCGAAACGAVFVCLPKEKRLPKPTAHSRGNAPKEWAETRNFLYYDGTVMPVVKEDLNEQ